MKSRLIAGAGIASLALLLPGAARAADAPCGLKRATVVAANERVAVVQREVQGEAGKPVSIVGEDKPVAVDNPVMQYWFCAPGSGARSKIGSDKDRPGLWSSSTVVAGRFAGVKVEWDAPGGAPDRVVALMVFDARAGKVVATETVERPYKCSCAGIGSFVLNGKGAYAFIREPAFDRIEVWKVVRGKRTLLESSSDGSDPAKPDSESLAMADGTYVYWRDEAGTDVGTAQVPFAGNPFLPGRGRGAPCGLQGAAIVESNDRVAVLIRTRQGHLETWMCAVGSGKLRRLGAGHRRVEVWDWHLAGRYAAVLVSWEVPGNPPPKVKTIYVYDAQKNAIVATESARAESHCQCAGIGTVVASSNGDYAFTTWPSDQRRQVVAIVNGKRTVLAGGLTGTDDVPVAWSLALDVSETTLYWLAGSYPRPLSGTSAPL